MPTLTINGTAFTGLPQGFGSGTLATGAYYSTDLKTGQPPMVGQIQKGYELVNFEGVAYTGRIEHFSFMSRPITATLIWANTLAGVEAAHKTFFDSAVQLARYTITMPGTTSLPGCVFAQARSQWFLNIDGNAVICSDATFLQLSVTN